MSCEKELQSPELFGAEEKVSWGQLELLIKTEGEHQKDLLLMIAETRAKKPQRVAGGVV